MRSDIARSRYTRRLGRERRIKRKRKKKYIKISLARREHEKNGSRISHKSRATRLTTLWRCNYYSIDGGPKIETGFRALHHPRARFLRKRTHSTGRQRRRQRTRRRKMNENEAIRDDAFRKGASVGTDDTITRYT